MSGYTYCRCRDCFETVVSSDMSNPDYCDECQEAGCCGGECKAPGAYGCEADILDSLTEEEMGGAL